MPAKQVANTNIYFDYGAKQGARRQIHSADLFVTVFAFASVLYFVLNVYRAIRICQVEILCPPEVDRLEQMISNCIPRLAN